MSAFYLPSSILIHSHPLKLWFEGNYFGGGFLLSFGMIRNCTNSEVNCALDRSLGGFGKSVFPHGICAFLAGKRQKGEFHWQWSWEMQANLGLAIFNRMVRCIVHPLIHYWLIRQAAEQHNALRTRMSYLFDHIDSLKVPCMESLIRLLCVPRVTSRWLSIMRKSYNYMDILSMPS